MALKIRRGTDGERLGIVPVLAEPLFTTDSKRLYIGDGETPGGVAPFALEEDQDPKLGADLDLNGNNIVGTGSIFITGTITASGTVELGGENGGGQIASNVVPLQDATFDLGTSSNNWKTLWAESANIRGVAQVSTLQIDANIVTPDSTVVFNVATNTLSVDNITASSITAGGFVGSFFSDDSGTIIDGITRNAYVNNLEVSGEVTVNDTVNVTADNFLNFRNTNPLNNVTFRVYLPDSGNWLETFTIANGTSGTGENNYISRGTFDVPESLQPGDILYGANVVGYDGSDYQLMSAVIHLADPNQTISTGVMPGTIGLATFTDGNPANFKGLLVDSRGYVSVNNGSAESQATLDINGFAKLAVLTAAPSVLVNGLIAIADGTSWNPTSSGIQTVVAYINNSWVALS